MAAPARPDLVRPPADPFELFDAWYAQAAGDTRIKYAAAVCLSTVDPDGFPDGRMVLLKMIDDGGFVFFTDAESVKGRSLLRFPNAALTFYWGPLDQQIRIRGGIEPASDAVSDECFQRRPRGSQVTAWASKQSRDLGSPAELEKRVAALTEKFATQDPVPRPPHWQAYRLVPRHIEFWAAAASRLHDRVLYSRTVDGTWSTRRLYP